MDVTPAEVAALLARHHRPLVGGAVAALGEGDFCHAFIVDDAWVVRVAKHAEAAEALRREACLLPALAAALPLSIPRPVHTFAGAGGDPAFTVHAMLPGPALTRERWEELAPARRDASARQVGDFLATLHGLAIAPARTCGVPTLDVEHRRATLAAEARLTLLPRVDLAARQLVHTVLRADPRTADAPRPAPVILHGDLSPDHVLCDAATGTVTGIIDFGDLAIGDPAWDLVFVYEDYGLDFLGALLPAYPAADLAGLLARMQRFLELDAVAWCVRCAGEDDGAALDEALAYLGALRARSDAPPWRALL